MRTQFAIRYEDDTYVGAPISATRDGALRFRDRESAEAYGRQFIAKGIWREIVEVDPVAENTRPDAAQIPAGFLARG